MNGAEVIMDLEKLLLKIVQNDKRMKISKVVQLKYSSNSIQVWEDYNGLLFKTYPLNVKKYISELGYCKPEPNKI